jgi:Holliday junction DNA helicase RuvB
MGLLNWIFEPIRDIAQQITDDISDKTGDIVSSAVCPQSFTPVGGDTKETSKYSPYRPKTLSEYIGQDRIKEFIMQYIKGLKTDNQARQMRNEPVKALPHILISGLAGTGKTTLAEIIANLAGSPITSVITSSLNSPMDIAELVHKKPKILFLDEIHSLASNRNLCETFYTIMEDFKWGRFSFEPFTLIGATTEKGEMIQKIKPFVDRFKIHLDLDNYTKNNMITIGKQYNKKVFPNYILTEKILEKISENTRQTPRLMIRLVESTVYFEGNLDQVLTGFNIINKGFYQRDLKALQYISQNEKGVGLQAISTYLQTTEKDYLYNIEPYLLCNNLITRKSRGRIITEQGKETIQYLLTKLKQKGE